MAELPNKPDPIIHQLPLGGTDPHDALVQEYDAETHMTCTDPHIPVPHDALVQEYNAITLMRP